MRMSSAFQIILQNMPQTAARPLQRPGDRRDADTECLRNFTHGHGILIVAKQIAALAVRQLSVPCLSHEPENPAAFFRLLSGKEAFLCAAHKTPDDFRIECKCIRRDPRPPRCTAFPAGDQCTSFAA